MFRYVGVKFKIFKIRFFTHGELKGCSADYSCAVLTEVEWIYRKITVNFSAGITIKRNLCLIKVTLFCGAEEFIFKTVSHLCVFIFPCVFSVDNSYQVRSALDKLSLELYSYGSGGCWICVECI